MKLKNKSGDLIHSGDFSSLKEIVNYCIDNQISLSKTNLRLANLSKTNLSKTNLSGADLSETDLIGANLSWANLSGADLSGANLRLANLSGANLIGANLRLANLSWANLSEANLRLANLSGADLSEANLSGANLRLANLSWADFDRTILHAIIINNIRLVTFSFGVYVVNISEERIFCGCMSFTHNEFRTLDLTKFKDEQKAIDQYQLTLNILNSIYGNT